MFVVVMNVEIFGFALSVVGRDEFADDTRQIILVGHLQSLCHMTDDNLCRFDVCQHLVGIDARLILRIIDRISQFTDIMVEGTCAHQLALCTNLVGYLASQIGNLYGVVERAWCHLAHLAQYFVVGIR